jgi:hypothetical protein
MAYTTIDDPTKYFETTIWTGSGGARTITGLNHKPDLIWTKTRSVAYNHMLSDSSRGFNANSELGVNSDAVEGGLSAETYGYKSGHTADGWTMVDGTDTVDGQEDGNTNQPNVTYVGWTWAANGGTATATGAESGNNPAYSAQANQTAGFSIITYTGTGAEGDVTHGLGGKPDWIITKVRNGNGDEPWVTWHKDLASADADNGAYIYLNTTGQGQTTSVFYEGDAISSTVVAFKGGNANVNADGKNYVMYCWRDIQGYSKFGSYTGNGSEDGPFVYLGFKPKWILFKNIGAAEEWVLQDTTRNPNNPVTRNIRIDSSIAEANASSIDFDFLSNGFKNRSDQAQVNSNGVSYIYMAFAEHPFVSSEGVPTTAR